MPPPTLTVSIVTYHPDLSQLDATLRKLSASMALAREAGLLRAVNLVLIDNTGERAIAEAVVKLGAAHFESSAVTMNYLHGHANIGYGAAHNLVMHGGNTHFHLVLNPDIELAEDALSVALHFFEEHEDVGVIVPAMYRSDGSREYASKRYPSVLDLALRGFAPAPLRQLFRRRLERYEMRDMIGDLVVSPVPVMGGSFMLLRRKAVEATGGFDPGYFLYFEDFDWSVRLNRVTRTAYVPTVRAVHHGGGAARKGWRHIAYFTRSGARFFREARVEVGMTGARPRRVLVTGAGGFIGRALCTQLARQGIAHVGAVRTTPSHSAEPLSEILALGDFAAAEWDAALSGVDSIVHLAGRAHMTSARDSDPTPHVVANVHVTRRLLDAAVKARVRRVVLASTVKVYGETTRPGRPFRADDPPHPRDAYARSKAAAEDVLWQVCREHGIEGVVLRLPLAYGPEVKGNFLLLLEAVAHGRRLPFAGVTNRRSLLYVGNAVSAIEAALHSPLLAGKILPIADAQSVSTPDLVTKIARLLGVTPRLSRVPTSVLRAGAALMGRRGASTRLLGSLEVDATRFCELASWTPPTTLDDGIAATVAWWRMHHAL